MAAAYEHFTVGNAGRVCVGATTSLWERVLVAAGICLPVPVLALTGLSIPLPVTVERLAASLVPWAHAASNHANDALARGADGEIVLSNGDRIVLVRAADGSTHTAVVTRRGRANAVDRRGVDDIVSSTTADPDGATGVAAAPGVADAVGKPERGSGGGAAAPGSASGTTTEPGGSSPAIDPPREDSAPASTSQPQPPTPNPATSPPKEEPNVVDTTVTTVDETVSTVTQTVQPVTDKVESTTTQVVETTKPTVGGLIPGAGG